MWCLDSLGEHGYLHIHHCVLTCPRGSMLAVLRLKNLRSPCVIGVNLIGGEPLSLEPFPVKAVGPPALEGRLYIFSNPNYSCFCIHLAAGRPDVHGIEILCCPLDQPVSVGAGGHLPTSLGKGLVFAAE